MIQRFREDPEKGSKVVRSSRRGGGGGVNGYSLQKVLGQALECKDRIVGKPSLLVQKAGIWQCSEICWDRLLNYYEKWHKLCVFTVCVSQKEKLLQCT